MMNQSAYSDIYDAMADRAYSLENDALLEKAEAVLKNPADYFDAAFSILEIEMRARNLIADFARMIGDDPTDWE